MEKIACISINAGKTLGSEDKLSAFLSEISHASPAVNLVYISELEVRLQLEPGETYQWQVVSTTSAGTKHEGPVWSFTVIKRSSAFYLSSGDAYVYRWSGNENYGNEDKLIMFKIVRGMPVRMSFLKFEISRPFWPSPRNVRVASPSTSIVFV